MKPPYWQEAMIRLARNEPVRAAMQGNRAASALAGRFIGGSDLDGALETAQRLRERGLRSSLFYLGEDTGRPGAVHDNLREMLALVRRLGERELDVFVCVDPARIGYALSADLGEAGAGYIGRAVAEQPRHGVNLVMLDMEDYAGVQGRLDLYERLLRDGVPAGITIQSYLRRSNGDARRLASLGGAVRLVKGAFSEPGGRAWRGKKAIAASYVRLAEVLLSAEAKTAGVYPVFATHDDVVVDEVCAMATSRGWQPEEYEIEMLLGVRPSYAMRLAAERRRVRLYVPYGSEWWAYGVCRVGENAANLRFVAESILRS